MKDAAFLRRYGHVADPWGMTPHQWFGTIEEIAEMLKVENGSR